MYMLDLPLSLYCLTVTQSAEVVTQLVEHWSRNPEVMDLNLISKTAQVFSLYCLRCRPLPSLCLVLGALRIFALTK